MASRRDASVVAENAPSMIPSPAHSNVWRRQPTGSELDSNVVWLNQNGSSTFSKASLTLFGSYVGVTSDVDTRIEAHNAGLSSHTATHRPWRRLVVIEFDEEGPALTFERYLKTGSGREFARRHFRQTVNRE